MAQDHNDIYSIVERLAILEGRITPATVKHGLNNQQKSVPQMPALFKPKTQKILGGDADDKNPISGYAVGGCEESEEEKTPVLEAEVAEDVLEKVRKSLNDYLENLEDELKTDSDLKDKKKEDSDLKAKDNTDRDLSPKSVTEHDSGLAEAAPIKTVTNECGLWEMHGDEHSGFEIRHGNRRLPSRFKTLDEAEMALEMFNIRRRKRDDAQDYIDEA